MLNIQKLHESGRLPHALLLLKGSEADVQNVISLHKADKNDVVFVKENMPPPDNKSKTDVYPYSYKIKALRKIVASGNMHPQFGETRVFVFNEFDTMSDTCQNALLKFIEEPHPFNKFIMVAGSKAKVLQTILSRVVVVSNAGEDEKNTETAEIAGKVVSALLSQNEYNAAAALAKVKDKLVWREILRSMLEKLCNAAAQEFHNADRAKKIIDSTDVVAEYIKRIETNPHMPTTTTACVAELCAKMFV